MITQEIIEQIISLRNNGNTLVDIARITGYSRTYVGLVYRNAMTREEHKDDTSKFFYAIFKRHFPVLNTA